MCSFLTFSDFKCAIMWIMVKEKKSIVIEQQQKQTSKQSRTNVKTCYQMSAR